MLRLVALLGLGGCASGVCDSCPSVSLHVNGTTELTAPAGTALTYVWFSDHADVASSSVVVEPSSPDACGISNGPWVVDTIEGTSGPVALAPCQAGSTYTLEVTVTNTATAETASASIVITVP